MVGRRAFGSHKWHGAQANQRPRITQTHEQPGRRSGRSRVMAGLACGWSVGGLVVPGWLIASATP